ncbi:uncharacterized protein ACLA_029110 [Aspergillus clavatus NRRL 1]|uniref:Uncharacterized protein n=1 Tax=Aspergillus clavatus (strain ATCC 1007 / CBS 513.65 / DSM 816 / NCTC 3887 / NRRL 1 / QM 1276 / 107) TaxID=344612 RepID=A1CRB2_ASPCL|nr:uncharacterized protein ACLA_029110 [Aspergillus clavatus NRRL 1]EAW08183.1 hypothetical protein ACLA_029110 [Aspergillus clavatus NRRL 1]
MSVRPQTSKIPVPQSQQMKQTPISSGFPHHFAFRKTILAYLFHPEHPADGPIIGRKLAFFSLVAIWGFLRRRQ